MNQARVVHYPFADIHADYSERDTVLYALGVGAPIDPNDPQDLQYVYEKNLKALPSLSCVLAQPGPWLMEPELGVDWVRILHAEQRVRLARPLPTKGRISSSFRVKGLVDKGETSGALLFLEKTLRDASGDLIGTVESTYFLRGDGGSGNWGAPFESLPSIPATPPNVVVDIPTLPIAALIYRLSGDYNPLHADPRIAKQAGFDAPILHGLCTFGVACHGIVRSACGGDATRLRSMGARFTKPVYPGETIRMECWLTPNREIQFRCMSIPRNEIVLDRGFATISVIGDP